VVVNDNHGSGYNIFFEDLDPRCEIIHGRNCSGPHWLPFLDESYDALVLIGMHAMGYTENAITPHSKWEVNGGDIYMGEGSMAAAIAGDMGIPTVFASGDDKVTTELSGKIDGLIAAVVKHAISPYQAKSLIPGKACELIYLGVLEGIRKRGEIQPYKIQGPVNLQLIESEGHLPPGKPCLDQPVEAETINEAFMKFEKSMEWTSFDTTLPDGFTYP
jgi:D-amino peptidase